MTSNLDDLMTLEWTQLWQVTAVAIVAGFLNRLCFRDRPHLAYAFWMLVVVKALSPPLWSSPMGVFSWALAERGSGRPVVTEAGPASIVPSGMRPVGATVGEIAPGPTFERFSPQGIFLTIWSMGLVVLLVAAIGKQSVCSILIRRSVLPECPDLIASLHDLRRRLGVRRRVRLVVSSRPIGPAAFGLLRPTIVLPKVLLAGRSPHQIELILAHELTHIKRGDILAGQLQLASQLLWWFHPLIWWANREATRERERCCDQDVVEGVGCRPAAYAWTLLSVLEVKSRLRIPTATPGVRAMEVTSRRLETIMKHRETRNRRWTWLPRFTYACGAILLVPGAGLTLPADADEKPKNAEAIAPPDKAIEKASPADKPKSEWQKRAEHRRKQGLEALRNQIFLAKSDVKRAEDRVQWAGKMFEKGYVSQDQFKREELVLHRAKIELEKLEADIKDLLQPPKVEKPTYIGELKIVEIDEDPQGQLVYKGVVEHPAKKLEGVTLKGVARDKGTGRPIAGASVSVQGMHTTVTDNDGRFTFVDIPETQEYKVVGSPKTGEPYLITSARVKGAKGEKVVTANLEFVRGIPFRVRVLDRKTGKPIKGHVGYYPTHRNPMKPGVVGYLGASDLTLGAFSEAPPDGLGDYRGSVLPGPGVLTFNVPYVDEKRAVEDHNPVFLYPDGDDGKTVVRDDRGKPIATMVPGSLDSNFKPQGMVSLALPTNDAVIVINPGEGSKEVTYEIKIDRPEASK